MEEGVTFSQFVDIVLIEQVRHILSDIYIADKLINLLLSSELDFISHLQGDSFDVYEELMSGFTAMDIERSGKITSQSLRKLASRLG